MRKMLQCRRYYTEANSFVLAVLFLLYLFIMVHAAPTPSPTASEFAIENSEISYTSVLITSPASSAAVPPNVESKDIKHNSMGDLIEFISPQINHHSFPRKTPQREWPPQATYHRDEINKKITNEKWLAGLRMANANYMVNTVPNTIAATATPQPKKIWTTTNNSDRSAPAALNKITGPKSTAPTAVTPIQFDGNTQNTRTTATTPSITLSNDPSLKSALSSTGFVQTSPASFNFTQSMSLIPFTYTHNPIVYTIPASTSLASTSLLIPLSYNANPPTTNTTSQDTGVLFLLPSSSIVASNAIPKAQNIDSNDMIKPTRYIKLNDFDGKNGMAKKIPTSPNKSNNNNSGTPTEYSRAKITTANNRGGDDDDSEKMNQYNSADTFSHGDTEATTQTSETNVGPTTESIFVILKYDDQTEKSDNGDATTTTGINNNNTHISGQSDNNKLDRYSGISTDVVNSSKTTDSIMKNTSRKSTGFLYHHKTSSLPVVASNNNNITPMPEVKSGFSVQVTSTLPLESSTTNTESENRLSYAPPITAITDTTTQPSSSPSSVSSESSLYNESQKVDAAASVTETVDVMTTLETMTTMVTLAVTPTSVAAYEKTITPQYNNNGNNIFLASIEKDIVMTTEAGDAATSTHLLIGVEQKNNLTNFTSNKSIKSVDSWRKKLHISTTTANDDDDTNRSSETTATPQETLSSLAVTSISTKGDVDDNDDDNLYDDIFEVIIDDRSIVKTKSTEAINKLLEADSEEFFVPEDIKERETTTMLAPTTTGYEVLLRTVPARTQVVTDNDNDDERLRSNPSTINHEADTIFYISNTEVKVVESVPTPNTNQESQFFPANYEEDVIIDFSSKNFSGWGSIPDKYEEDIILSPLKNNFDPARMTAGGISNNDDEKNSDNLSISYIGESFIEVKEFTSDGGGGGGGGEPVSAGTPPQSQPSAFEDITANVIIQPVAIIPPQEQQQQQPQIIGVPIIAELPQQIGSNFNFYPQLDQQNQQPLLPHALQNKELYVDVNHFSIATDDPVSGNGLIQNSLQINQLNAELPLLIDDTSQMIDGKRIPSKRNNVQLNLTGSGGGGGGSAVAVESSTLGPVLNNTAFSVLNDDPENSEHVFLGFNDTTTLILACVATIIPLVLCVLFTFAVRYFWHKYRRDHSATNGIVGDNSTDPLAVKSRTVSVDELKSTESGYSIKHSNTVESSAEIVSKYNDGTMAHKTNHSSGANGSVITMTLKNNHLIVETEERHDMARDARETKMHYSPSEKDGVFVVEVARGADSTVSCNGKINNNKLIPQKSQLAELNRRSIAFNGNGNDSVCRAHNDEIQVHQPPTDGASDEELLTVDEDGGVSMASLKLTGQCEDLMRSIGYSTNTGLSQSDLSRSSSCGSNEGYTYGAQQPYSIDNRGYQTSSPHINFNGLPPLMKDGSPDSPNLLTHHRTLEAAPNSKPIIMAAIYKQVSVDPGSSYPEDGRPAKLRTDKNASLLVSAEMPSKTSADSSSANMMSPSFALLPAKEEILIEEQRLLGNGVLLAIDESICNGVDPSIESESGPFDSLINLPAPPTIDEIKLLNDITLLDNNNMDSLPPPPPEVVVDGPPNCPS